MGFFKSAAKASIATTIVNRLLNRGSRRSSWGRNTSPFGRTAATALPFAYGRNAALGGLAIYAFNKYRQSRANAAMKTPVHP